MAGVLISMRVLLWAVFSCGLSSIAAIAADDFDAARALFDAKRYPEARAAFETIVAAEPANAAACHFLGRAIVARNDNAAYEEGLKWLAKAVELEPRNPRYLGIYGGTSLQLAGRTNSLSAASKGREAMEKAVALDPGYLDAHEGLYQFYERAPWPIGSSAKAAAHLEAIRKRDPERATVLGVMAKTRAKDYGAAFKLCEAALAKNPDNYFALYHYGRTASISGQNLPRGIDCLKRCLALEPPSPASPSHSNACHRLGTLEEKLGHAAAARTAYNTALQLDSSNSAASEALNRLKSTSP